MHSLGQSLMRKRWLAPQGPANLLWQTRLSAAGAVVFEVAAVALGPERANNPGDKPPPRQRSAPGEENARSWRPDGIVLR